MTVHIVKLCVGTDSIEDLADWQRGRLAQQRKQGVRNPRIVHATFQAPKRRDEALDGGSLYWVIKGLIAARQRLIGLEDGHKQDGRPACLLVLDSELVPVRPTPRRPFQGWRYLEPEDAPADIARGDKSGLAELPPAMRKELASLGLL